MSGLLPVSSEFSSVWGTNAESSSRAFTHYGLPVAVAKALPLLAVLFVTPWIGTESLGQVSVLAALLAIASVLGDSGIDSAATIALSSESSPVSRSVILRKVLMLRAFVSAGSVVILGVILVPEGDGPTIILTVALLPVASLIGAIASVARLAVRVDRPARESQLLLVERSTVALSFVGLLAVDLSPQISYVLAWVIGSSLMLVAARVPAGIVRNRAADTPQTMGLGQLIAGALPLAVSAICSVLYWRLDVFFLERLHGASAAGSYTMGYYPVMALAGIPGSAAILLLRQQARGLRAQVLAAAVLGVSALFLCGGLIASLAHALSPDLFTDTSADVLRIAALGLPAIWINPQVAAALRTLDLAWPVATVSVGALALNVVLNSTLIPNGREAGAAWASTITEWSALLGVALIWRFRVARRRRRTPSDPGPDTLVP